jgi:ABC-type transporter lipoprotein component MlaA
MTRAHGIVILGLLVAASGCGIETQRNDWTTYSGPGAAAFQKEEYTLPLDDDPLEPVNRLAWGLNDVVLTGLIDPVSKGWRAVVPQVARDHLNLAADNLGGPGRSINHLLQGDWDASGHEALRFLTNTTIGVVGLFDPATAWDLEARPTSTSDTLIRWGWDRSTYLTLPALGPSTPRDALGRAGDALLDPATWFFPAGPVKQFVQLSEFEDPLLRFMHTQPDAYAVARLAWMAHHGVDVLSTEHASSMSAAHETLRAATVACHDPWFPTAGYRNAVRIDATGRKLPYDLWLQPGRAPIVYVIPGLGDHRRSPRVMVLAESLYDAGASVATFSSAMNIEFMNTASTVDVPGYAPLDIADVRQALLAIDRDVRSRHRHRIGDRATLGVSLGAFHALMISAQTPDDTGPLLCIAPPVQLRHGMNLIDLFYNVPLRFEPASRDQYVAGILRTAGRLLQGDLAASSRHLTEAEAQFLIGLTFRINLHDVIWASQERVDLGFLKTPRHPLRRVPASREILEFSYEEYFYAFVLPTVLPLDAQLTSADDLFERCDLRWLGDALRGRQDIEVVITANDFVLAPEDQTWLVDQLGERVHVVERGGHLGNLQDAAVSDPIRRFVNNLNSNGLSVGR